MAVLLGQLLLLCALAGAGTGLQDEPSASCQQEFLIRQGTIIRTVDSRRRGAVFLNISQLTETAVCLERCCHTPACNAAIFDQKTHSCFMFDCGPRDDYRCLFTSHAQFISATLRHGRAPLRAAEVPATGGVGLDGHAPSQHEVELASLKSLEPGMGPVRQPEPASALRPPVVQQPRQSLETPLAEMMVPPATPGAASPATECSRFQFECGSGECVAIYNACDGVPQCADQSDESPQLACPSGDAVTSSSSGRRWPEVSDSGAGGAAVAPAASVPQGPAPPPQPPPQGPPPAPPPPPAADAGRRHEMGWQRPRPADSSSALTSGGDIFNHRQQGVLSTLSHFPAVADAGRNPYQQPPLSSYRQYPAQGPPMYDDLLVPWPRLSGGGYSSPYDPMPPRYQLMDPSAPLPPRPPLPEQQPPDGVGDGSQLGLAAPPVPWRRPAINPHFPLAGVADRSPLENPQPLSDQRASVDRGGASTDQVSPVDHHAAVDHQAPAAQPSVAPAAPTAAAASTQKSSPTTGAVDDAASTLRPSTAPPLVDQVQFSLSELRAQAALQSAEAQGAAIVLTLGVLLSAILVVAALCRLHCVRKSAARPDRANLAHDADYLVNGMYL